MGYPKETFISQILNEHLCLACHQVLQDPVECQDCSASFCKECNFKESVQKCPKCQSVKQPIMLQSKVAQSIENLIIKCQTCGTQMALKEQSKHLSQCLFQENNNQQDILKQGNDNLSQKGIESSQMFQLQQNIQQVSIKPYNQSSQKAKETQEQIPPINQKQDFMEFIKNLEKKIYQNEIEEKNELTKIQKEVNELKAAFNASKGQVQSQNLQISSDIGQISNKVSILEQTIKNILNQSDYLIKMFEQQNSILSLQSDQGAKGKLQISNQFANDIEENELEEKLQLLEENNKKLQQIEAKVKQLEQLTKQNQELAQQQQAIINQLGTKKQEQQNQDIDQLNRNYNSKIETLNQMVKQVFEKPPQQDSKFQQNLNFKKQSQEQNLLALLFNPITSHKSLKFDSQKKMCQFSKESTYRTTIFSNRLEKNKTYSVVLRLKKGEHFIFGVTKVNQSYDQSFTNFQTGWGFRNHFQDFCNNMSQQSNSLLEVPSYGEKLLPEQEIEMNISTKYGSLSYLIDGIDYGLAFQNRESTFNDGDLYIALAGCEGCIMRAVSIQEIRQ